MSRVLLQLHNEIKKQKGVIKPRREKLKAYKFMKPSSGNQNTCHLKPNSKKILNLNSL